MEVLDRVYLGNTAVEWAVSLAVLVLVLAALEIVKGVVVRRMHALAEKTSTPLDDVLAELLAKTRFHMLK